MRGRIRLAALCAISLSAAAACERLTQPTTPSSVAAPAASSVTYTPCVGTLTGVLGNVLAPPGASCLISDATVTGSVWADRASVVVIRAAVSGDLQGQSAESVRAENVQIGGKVLIQGGRVAILDSVVVRGGDVEISSVSGASSAVVVEDVQVLAGNVELLQNAAQTLRLARSRATQTISVQTNRGPGTKQVVYNAAGASTQCWGNDLPFEGGPNTAPTVGGQCFAAGAPPPSTSGVASDDFERYALGANWTQVGTSAGGIVGGRDLGIITAGALSVDWAATLFPADQFSEILVAAAKDPDLMVQLHLRRQSGASLARYGFHFNGERVPAAWEIKYDGVPTLETRILAFSTTTAAPAPGDVVRFEARGRVLTGYKNGRVVITATDWAPNAILLTGGTGITARIARGTTTVYPSPVAASWRGGALR